MWIQVSYLGHVVSAQGVALDQSKIQALVEWPIPKNIKELRGFLGLTGSYRKFIAHYAKIVGPLMDQLRVSTTRYPDSNSNPVGIKNLELELELVQPGPKFLDPDPELMGTRSGTGYPVVSLTAY